MSENLSNVASFQKSTKIVSDATILNELAQRHMNGERNSASKIRTRGVGYKRATRLLGEFNKSPQTYVDLFKATSEVASPHSPVSQTLITETQPSPKRARLTPHQNSVPESESAPQSSPETSSQPRSESGSESSSESGSESGSDSDYESGSGPVGSTSGGSPKRSSSTKMVPDGDVISFLKQRHNSGQSISVNNARRQLHIGYKRAHNLVGKFLETHPNVALSPNAVHPNRKRKSNRTAQTPARSRIGSSTTSKYFQPDDKDVEMKTEAKDNDHNSDADWDEDKEEEVKPYKAWTCGTSDCIVEDAISTEISQRYKMQIPNLSDFKLPPLEIPEGANIVLILGASGSGKTTYLSQLGNIDPHIKWNPNAAIVSLSHFKTTNMAMTACQCIGFNTVPDWFKPQRVLSQGEQYRARLARIHTAHVEKKSPMLLDEFTSNIDRPVARSTAASIGKWIRRSGSKAIFTSSNVDIVPYLQPDVVVSLVKGRPPKIIHNPNPENRRLRPQVAVRFSPRELAKPGYSTKPVVKKPTSAGSTDTNPIGTPEKQASSNSRKRKKPPTPPEYPYYSKVLCVQEPNTFDEKSREFFRTYHSSVRPILPPEYIKPGEVIQEKPYRSTDDILRFLAKREASGTSISASCVKSIGVGWKRAKRIVTEFQENPDKYRHLANEEEPEPDDVGAEVHASTPNTPPIEVRYGGLQIDRRVDGTKVEGVHLECRVKMDAATREASAQFDYRFEGAATFLLPGFPRDEIKEFTLGVMNGPSGSGKTQLVFQHFQNQKHPEPIVWHANKSIASHFNSTEDATERLTTVCLDQKTWLLPLDVLSEGEQERANLARGLGTDGQIFDEFTSFVDRPTAHRMAKSVSNYLYRNKVKGCILIACHSDLLGPELLVPTWLFDTYTKQLVFFKPPKEQTPIPSECPPSDSSCSSSSPSSSSSLSNRGPADRSVPQELGMVVEAVPVEALTKNPPVAEDRPSLGSALRDSVKMPEELQFSWDPPKLLVSLHKCQKHLWRMFASHHYMDGKLQPASRTFVAQLHLEGEGSGEIVGFVASIIHFGQASKSGLPRMREHRTVVLPQYQGLGIGTRLSDAIAHLHFLEGYEYYSKTAHPRFGQYRNTSPLWAATAANGSLQKERTDYKDKRLVNKREAKHRLKQKETAKRPWVAKVYACHKYIGPSEKSMKYFDGRIFVV